MLKRTILCIACSQALWMSVASSAEKISTDNGLYRCLRYQRMIFK